MKKILLGIVSMTLGLSSCLKMDVQNLNNPDMELVLQDPDGVRSVGAGTFKTWFGAIQDYKSNGVTNGSVAQSMMTMADAGTTFWYNFGCVDLSLEPREAYMNEVGYTYSETSEWYYKNLMMSATTATDVLALIEDGMELGVDGKDTEMVRGLVKFVQGLSNGYIGLVYDQAFTINTLEDYQKGADDLSTYQESIELGVIQIEEAIAIYKAADDFTLPVEWLPSTTVYTKDKMIQLMHSYAARLLMYSSRTKAQNDAVDWIKVLDHAKEGIKDDFAPISEGKLGGWNSGFWLYTISGKYDWQSIDMRIVNMLDPSMPSTFPVSGKFSDLPDDGIAKSLDDRINTDFEDEQRSKDRGSYLQSNLRYKRFDNFKPNYGQGERIVEFTKVENDLIIAEAIVRSGGDLTAAAGIINDGTRVTRGRLTEISANEDEILDAIWYERNVEILYQGVGVQYFDMRRHDLLQKGTMLHFPFPADQYELLARVPYTFGGDQGVAGEDYSIGGWK